MGTGAVLALVVGAVGTVLLVLFVTMVLVQRVTRAYHASVRAIERLQPALEELAMHQEVARRELAAIEARRTASF